MYRYLIPVLMIIVFVGLYGQSHLHSQSAVSGLGEQNRYLGHVIANREVDIKPEVSGRIKKLLIKQGDAVKQGQLLVQLDEQIQDAVTRSAKMQAETESAVERAKLQVKLFKVRLDRLEDLKKQSVGVPKEELEEARIAYEDAKLQVTIAEENLALAKVNMELETARLKQYQINAAFDGHIREIYTSAGASVIPDEPVLKIVDLDPLKAVIHLPGSMRPKLKQGDSYELQLGAPVNKAQEGKLIFIDPGHSSAAGTVRCHFEISNKSFSLPYGISVHLKIK